MAGAAARIARPRRQEKKDETRRAILSAAARLFARKGFEAATLEEIAEKAGVHKQTVLRYFASKEEVAFGRRLKLFERFSEDLAARSGSVLAFWRRYIEETSAATAESGELADWFDSGTPG